MLHGVQSGSCAHKRAGHHVSSSAGRRPISNFVRAARLVGLEVLAELDLDDDYALDEELLAPHREMASPTLYATMPTRESFERFPRLWRAYQRGERPEKGYAPWTRLFEMLDDLRAWGPEDLSPLHREPAVMSGRSSRRRRR